MTKAKATTHHEKKEKETAAEAIRDVETHQDVDAAALAKLDKKLPPGGRDALEVELDDLALVIGELTGALLRDVHPYERPRFAKYFQPPPVDDAPLTGLVRLHDLIERLRGFRAELAKH